MVNPEPVHAINLLIVKRRPSPQSGVASDRPKLDRVGFADLSARVYRLCLAILGSESDACEAAQEALVRAWSRRSRKREDVSWWTWAGGFAVRVCREVRRDGTASPSTRSLDDTMATSRAVLPQSGFSGPPRLAELYDAIMALPRRQREVTVLRFLIGLSTQQTAGMLGCPEGTVKSNLHKAVANLRATVEPRGLIHEMQGI